MAGSINKDCKIKIAIIDKDVDVPPNTEVGYDLKQDKNGFLSTKNLGSSLSPRVTNFPDPIYITQ